MLAFLRETVFAKKFDVDDRDLALQFNFPGVGPIGLYGIDLQFWAQIVSLVLVATVFNVLLSVIIFKFVVQKQWTTTAYMTGFGIVFPMVILWPFAVVEMFDLSNVVLVVVGGASTILLVWRLLEAVYDTMPKFAKAEGLKSYVLYYASLINFSFDPKTHMIVPSTSAAIKGKMLRLLSLFCQCTFMFNLLEPVNYEYFRVPRGDESSVVDWFCYVFSPAHIANNFLMACTFGMCLDILSTALGLPLMLLFGYETMDIMNSPMSRSQSASDFWGLRWNTLVSHALKRGVFVPLRKYAHWSRPASAITTFFASGVIHEFILLMVAYSKVRDPFGDWQLVYTGSHLAFFCWNGVILFLEHMLRDTVFLKWPSENLHPFIKTPLVIMSVLPLGHLFTDLFVENGFFSSFALGFPKFEILQSE